MGSEEDDEVCAADALAPIEPLGFAHPLQPREPAIGFAARLAALNGVDLATLLREMRVDALRLDHGREVTIRDVAALGRLNAEDTAALLRNSPRRLPEERASLLGSERLEDTSLRRTSFGVCPHCIRDDIKTFDGPLPARPWLRLEWQFEHVRSCRRHDVMLIGVSPVDIRTKPPDFSLALRERILPELDRLVAAAIPVQHSAFEDWVVARLDGIRDDRNWLDTMPLRVGAVLCEGLGISALHAPKVKLRTLSETDRAKAGDEGFRIAESGESAIVELLSRLADAQQDTRGVVGLRNTYGYVHELLRRTQSDADFDRPRDIVRRHALDTLPLDAGTDVLGVVLDRRRVHTVHTAALASGVHPGTIRKMLVRDGVSADGLELARSNHRVTILSEDFVAGLARLPGAISVPRVRERTGIPTIHLWSMISQGFLPTLTKSQVVSHAKHMIAPDDVDALMARLFAGAETVARTSARRTTLMRARQCASAPIDRMIAWLLDGSLRWKGRIGAEMRYGNLLIDADELTALVRTEPQMTGMTAHAVLQAVPGLGKSSVPALVRLGLLSTREEFNPNNRQTVRAITRESLDAFRTTYVLLKELCSICGLGHLAVRRHLEASGVDLAFSPADIRAFVYPRVTALEAIRTGAAHRS